MKKQLYPAVLERVPKGAFGAWFPDFPGCVAGGRSHEQTIERAENALAPAVDRMFEHGRPLPAPTPISRIVLPKGCDFLAYFIVGVDPPDPSERVNVYLPKSLIGQGDKRAATNHARSGSNPFVARCCEPRQTRQQKYQGYGQHSPNRPRAGPQRLP